MINTYFFQNKNRNFVHGLERRFRTKTETLHTQKCVLQCPSIFLTFVGVLIFPQNTPTPLPPLPPPPPPPPPPTPTCSLHAPPHWLFVPNSADLFCSWFVILFMTIRFGGRDFFNGKNSFQSVFPWTGLTGFLGVAYNGFGDQNGQKVFFKSAHVTIS